MHTKDTKDKDLYTHLRMKTCRSIEQWIHHRHKENDHDVKTHTKLDKKTKIRIHICIYTHIDQ